MSADNYRGLRAEDEIKSSVPRRDTRTAEQQFRDLFANPRVVSIFLVGSYMIAFAFPLVWWFIFPVGVVLTCVTLSNQRYLTLPMRLPREAPISRDRNSRKPGGGYQKPQGQFYIGVEKDTNAQLWESSEDFLRHWLVVGATGSGKTVTLVSMCANALAMGSGAYYSDAKATPDLGWRIYTLARYFGRDHDFLVTNYITGTAKTRGRQPSRLTNTDNPYAIGTADSLYQLLSSMMSESGDGNKIFYDRALALLQGILFALVELRDNGHILLSIKTITQSLSLQNVLDLRHNPDLSERARRGIYDYLDSALPGYDDSKRKATDQHEEVTKQHGYAQSYFTRAAASITDTYAHIFLTDMGEIDRADVVLNRRIAVNMLPALEKSDPELEMLGRMNYAAVRDALRLGLGAFIEGSKTEALDNLPTASDVPMLMIWDELAYQMVDGMDITAAQARGLGLSMVFAMQDFAGPQKANEKSFQQLVGNTINKMIMKLEEPQATWNQIQTIAGEGLASETQSLERRGRPIWDDYRDQQSAAYQRRSRIDLMDLRNQIEGEAHLLYGDRIIRMDAFAVVDLPLIENFRINRFLCVGTALPTDYPELSAQMGGMADFFSPSSAGLPPGLQARQGAAFGQALAALAERRGDGFLMSGIAALATYRSVAAAGDTDGGTDEVDGDGNSTGDTGGGNSGGAQLGPTNNASTASASEPTTAEGEHGQPASSAPDGDTLELEDIPREPDFAESDEPVDDYSEVPHGDDFLGRALDTTEADYLFSYEAEYDLDYDIGETVAANESRIDPALSAEQARLAGEQLQAHIRNTLRYPSPPEPELTSDVLAVVESGISVLEARNTNPGADADGTSRTDIFGGQDPEADI